MARVRRKWTHTAARISAFCREPARIALGIFERHRLREDVEARPKTVYISPMKGGGYSVRVDYADGRTRTFWIGATRQE